MSLFKVNEDTFAEVKSLIEDGTADSKIMYDLGLQRPTINIIKRYDNFDDYEAHFEGGDAELANQTDDTGSEEKGDDEQEDETPDQSRTPAKLEPLQKGYFRGKVTKTLAPQVQEADDALRISIRGLWKIIGLLESRKTELQREINAMERYIQQGIDLIETHIEK